ncbi:hypothetical protein [Peribacillus simplex]|uniref:hypothetical protein n=1 Tax=Peribacillus simplex TaxID=1478 RepID=UPI0021AA0E9B|nr:hypothetical protein [Peribacillus simplex]
MEKVVEGSLFKSLSSRHIPRYKEWLSEKSPYVLIKGTYTVSALSSKTTIIKSFLKFLVESGYITEAIHEGFFKNNIRIDDRPNRDLGAKEVIQLLDYFREINHPIIFSIIHILTCVMKSLQDSESRIFNLIPFPVRIF